MKKITHQIFLAVFILTSCTSYKNLRNKTEIDTPYLIVLSLDGFRWDYPDSVNTPNLDKIARMGVKAKSIQASFPTKTFPNHYTIATGLYPNNNGIVNNTFLDTERNLIYSIGNRDAVEDEKFYLGEPIWNTAEKQGLKAATFYWVGSEAPIQNMRPSIWKRYEHNFPFEQRIDTVISWLQLPSGKRPHLIMWYMHEPDGIGHRNGPFSAKTNEKIEYLDLLIGDFMQKLEKLPHANKINVIILSDHGMGSISNDKQIFLDEILKPEWVANMTGDNPFYNIKANQGYLDSIFNVLDTVDGITAYKSGQIPKRLNYGSSKRALDMVVYADSSYSLLTNSEKAYYSKGTHGYDNSNTDMDAIFYAYGPAFKTNYLKPRFANVSLYELFCKILKLRPEANDGNKKEIEDILR
jgi:alkaline phosphatase D